MNQITSVSLASALTPQAPVTPADDSSVDFAAVLEAHISADAAPARATLDTSAITRRELQSQPRLVTSESNTQDDVLADGASAAGVPAEGVSADAVVSTDTEAEQAQDTAAATSSADTDTTPVSGDDDAPSDADLDSTAVAEAVIAQLTPAPVVLTPSVHLPSFNLGADVESVDAEIAALSGALAGEPVLTTPLAAPLDETSVSPLPVAAPSVPTAPAADMVTATVVDLAIVTDAPVAALVPVADSFESTLQTALDTADQAGPLTASLATATTATTEQPDSQAAPQPAALLTLPLDADQAGQAMTAEAAATNTQSASEKLVLTPSAEEGGSLASPAAGAQQLKGAVAASQAGPVKEPARVIQTDNIRSEVWEIAKRAQALSRVEAVIRTSQGDLTVVARHTGSGVSVTLGGEALESLDLTALRNELPGLDVSVNQGQQEHRAPQEQQDTVPSQAAQPARPIIRPISQSPQGLLDTHA